MSIPILKAILGKKKFSEVHFGVKFGHFLAKKGLNVNFNYFDPQKFESYMIPRILIYRASRSVQWSDLYVVLLQSTGLTYRRTDGRTELSSPDRVCVLCGAVKT